MSDPTPEIRKILKGMVDAVTEHSGGDSNKALTALALAVHFFCRSTNYSHEYFCKQVMDLKERDE